ncbi:MAG: hypothetical protein QY323_02350 [Patescibacteria group bacterium]|nr:MAG: hypothetical protein QY323_02350 [Patescibacteria group bacterium]
MQDTTQTPKTSGLDTVIKVLTIIKLVLQVAFYGWLLGGLLWFLLENPLPEMIQGLQEQVVKSFMQGGR